MLYINTIRALKLAFILTISYLISMGMVDFISYEFKMDNLSTTDLLDTLYIILNLLFFMLTVLLIKLFMEDRSTIVKI